MAIASKKALTREEELLLQDFSSNVSSKTSALFYGNSFILAVLPIWLFWRIHNLDVLEAGFVYLVVTGLTTWLVAFAYKNSKFVLKHKIAQKREDAVTKEVMRQLNDDKKLNKKEKDERVLWMKNEVADYEATTFAIFYNNALFLALLMVLSTAVLSGFTPTINYIVSVAGSAGLIALFSTGTSK
ncbi:Translocon-associated protein subunit gamma [Halotydeus destructor]|nr:Translocon-associated protein subunit gamma [Halotydeus destructor]